MHAVVFWVPLIEIMLLAMWLKLFVCMKVCVMMNEYVI